MNNDKRKSSDYKIDGSYYYVNCSKSIPQYVDFYRVRLSKWDQGFSNVEGSFIIENVFIGEKTFVGRKMQISIGWMTPTFDEGIMEIVNSKVNPKTVVRQVFK